MSKEMEVYNRAYQELEEAILMALDDAYSDGVDMDEAFQQITDYVNESGCGNQTSMCASIYTDWKADHDFSKKVVYGAF